MPRRRPGPVRVFLECLKGLCSVLLLVLCRASTMASLFWRKDEPEDSAAKDTEKLKGYHELVRDILKRAAAKHTAGEYGDAIKLYQMGQTVCDEALAMKLAHLGIGSSNIGVWRADLSEWREGINRYIDREKAGEPNHTISPPMARAPPNRTRSSAASKPQPSLTAKRPVWRSTSAKIASPPEARHSRTTKLGADEAGGSTQAGGQSSVDSKLREMILGEVLDSRPTVAWNDIAGLTKAKQALQELVILPALRSDLFQGIRAPARGLLLYGPPGNGKTMLARALANEANATFFSLSASSLTSRWMGEGEKLVRTLFALAREMAPSVIFLDEIDSLLSSRSEGEHEASRRLKTEFLVQFDGMSGQQAHVVVIGATNRPQELDDAVRRRLEKRIYISLPEESERRFLLNHLLRSAGAKVKLTAAEVKRIAKATDGYSGADLTALCREAAMQPLRELGSRLMDVKANDIRPVSIHDFASAVDVIKPSVDSSQLAAFEEWTRKFGSAT